MGRCGLDSSVSGQGSVTGCCVHGNEPSGYINGGNLLGQLSDYELFKKDSAPTTGSYQVKHCQLSVRV